MHCPVVYNKDGLPISGGRNKVTKSAKCLSCKKVFFSIQSEINDLYGIDRVWEEVVKQS
jgi:hypothetical protein